MTEIEEKLKQGIAALKAGRRKEARAILLQVLEHDEENEQAWLWMSAAVETDKLRRTCLEKVVEINPDNAHALKGLRRLTAPEPGEKTAGQGILSDDPAAVSGEGLQQAKEYLRNGQKQAAREALRNIVNSQPETEAAWLLLARTFEDIHLRRNCLRRVLDINPANEEARKQLDLPTDEEKQHLRPVMAKIRESLQQRPEDGGLHYRLGLCYYRLGLLDDAILRIRKAVSLMPEKIEPRYKLATLQYQNDNLEEALLQLDRIVALDSTFSPALVLRGIVHKASGSIRKAVEEWQKAARLGDETSYEHLEIFVDDHKHLMRERLEPDTVPEQFSAYFRPDPTEPRPLGSFSMQVLETVWPTKADEIRDMHEARVAEYRQSVAETEKHRRAMEHDVLAFSTLCVKALASQALSIDRRRAILNRAIREHSVKGFRVVSRTDTSAQLIRPKEFSFWWAFFWFLFLVVGFIVYLLYYAAKRDTVVYLEVDPTGKVITRR